MGQRQPPREQDPRRTQSTPTAPPKPSGIQQLGAFLAQPLVSTLVSIIGLVCSFVITIIPNPVFITWLFGGLTLVFLGLVLWTLRSWFTRKFFIGLAAGIIIGGVLFPTIFEPTYLIIVPLFAPRLTVFH